MNQTTELYNNLDRVMAMAQYEMIGISVGVVRAEKRTPPGYLSIIVYIMHGKEMWQIWALRWQRYCAAGMEAVTTNWTMPSGCLESTLLLFHHS